MQNNAVICNQMCRTNIKSFMQDIFKSKIHLIEHVMIHQSASLMKLALALHTILNFFQNSYPVCSIAHVANQ